MKRRVAALAGAATAAFLLAACAPPLPTPQPDAIPASVEPALTVEQIEDVLGDIAGTLKAADETFTAGALDARVTGPAKRTREVQYSLAALDAGTVTTIPADVQTVMDPATDTWPRTVMAVTEAPEDLKAPLLLTLVQNSPREQFQLCSWVRLFPGVEVPATTQPEIGSATVPLEANTVSVWPSEVMPRYMDVLTNGSSSEHASTFVADDPLRAQMAGVRAGYSSLLTDKGSLTENYGPIDSGPYTIGTADGGAIVVAGMQTVTSITLVDSTLSPTNPASALLGKPTVASNMTIVWLSTVAFAVPPAGSTAPINVLGAEHVAIQVTGE